MANNSFTNIFTGNPTWVANVSYVTYPITGNISLNWPTQFLDVGNVVGNWTTIIPNNNGYSVILPDATAASVGQSIVFINNANGNFNFILKDNSGNTLVTINSGKTYSIVLTDNSTIQGTWLIFPFSQGTTAVTSVGATTTSAGLTINGSPITSAGNLVFTLASGLQAIANLNATGIMVQSSTGPSLMTTVSIIGGVNIDVTNGDGTLGNPTIDLSDTLTNLSSVRVGSLTLSNNSIATTAGNTNIQISPNGTGSILLGSGLNPPSVSSTGNITNINNLTATQINTPNLTTSVNNGNISINGNGTGGVNIQTGTSTGDVTLQNASANPFSISSTGLISHPAIPVALVAFVGTTGVISKSYNVSAVTRNSIGNYTLTIPNGIITGLMKVFVGPLSSDGTTMYVGNLINTGTTQTNVNIQVRNLANALADPILVYVEIFQQ